MLIEIDLDEAKKASHNNESVLFAKILSRQREYQTLSKRYPNR